MSSTCTTPYVGNCTCRFNHVWSNNKGVVIYPRSQMLLCKGLLMRYLCPTHKIFGIHKLQNAQAIRLFGYPYPNWYLTITGDHIEIDDGDWANAQNHGMTNIHAQNIMRVYGVGLRCVRTLQRWFRGALSKRRQERILAIMMATHKRLGSASLLHGLDEALLQRL